MKLFAGLDVSTQSCKLVIINHESCEAVYTDTVIYDRDLQHYTTIDGVETGLPEGVSESNPEMWLEAVNALFKKLAESEISQVEIKSISVSGQQHGLVGLDVHGNLTRSRSKLWNDFSTQEECELLTEKVGGPESMIQEIGNTQRTGYTASKIFHMVRREYETYARTTTFFLVHNYMNWYLTGAKDGGVRVMEPGDTSGMALWNPATRQWSKKVIDAIDTGLQDKLPPVMPSTRALELYHTTWWTGMDFHRNVQSMPEVVIICMARSAPGISVQALLQSASEQAGPHTHLWKIHLWTPRVKLQHFATVQDTISLSFAFQIWQMGIMLFWKNILCRMNSLLIFFNKQKPATAAEF